MSFVAPDYRAELYRFVDGYEGAHQAAILRAGDVFDLYARLMMDKRLDRDSRHLVIAVLAYFVVPDDVLPEADLGPYGLLDDLFLAGHVWRLMRSSLDPALIEDAWQADDDVREVMDVVYSESRHALGKQRKDVLRVAGLD